MSGDFLSRWSRRKRAALEPQAEAPPPSEAGSPAQAAEVEAQPGDPPILPLPALEELTANSDATAFLQRGVPASLRNAALRRMWSLDPAIRDYVGDARDYAWDWNVPGGVPGTGPLSIREASGAAREMWRSLGGEPAAEPEPISGRSEPHPDEAGSPEASSPVCEATAPETDRGAPETPLLASAPPVDVRSVESSPLANCPETARPAPRSLSDLREAPLRRHGRARPV